MEWFILAQQPPNTHDPSSWLTFGLLGSLFVIFLADKALGYLKTRGVDLQVTCKQIEEMHEWHNHDHPDDPGVKIWWNRKYQYDVIKEIVGLQRDKLKLLTEMQHVQKSQGQVDAQQVKLMGTIIERQDMLLHKLDLLLEKTK